MRNSLAMKYQGIIVVVMLCFAACALAAEHKVSSAADIKRVAADAKPGDVLIMTDGKWKDQAIHFKANGNADNPITLRAESPGKVILTGKSTISIDGQYAVVSGALIQNGGGDFDAVEIVGDHCRLTESAVVDCKYKFDVHVYGAENRVDHCYLAGKTSVNPTLQIEAEEHRPNHDQIDHNHFGPRPPLGQNGGETMRVGYSWQSFNSSASVVEHNLFDRCDGEIEIISSKSCDNVYRYNTFLNCAGMLTLRHGNRATVESNFFIGNHKRGSGGIRIIGEDHKIINNYIEGVSQGAFWITSGIQDSPLRGYFRAMRALIAFNTVIDCPGPNMELSAGIGTSNRTLMPVDITLANNLFSLPKDATLTKGKEGENYKWVGNIVSGTGEKLANVKSADVKFARDKEGILRPVPNSANRGAAEGTSVQINTDIDGQPRQGKIDVGCDQNSDAPVTNRPLGAKDVGPSWMSVADREKTAMR